MIGTLFSGILAIASAAGQPATFAVPPPVEQLTADCNRPVYASDQLVCEDGELRSLDEKLAGQVRDKPQLGTLKGSTYYEAQSAWFKRRSLCAMKSSHRQCLLTAYAERIRIVDAMGSITPTNQALKSCKPRKVSEAIRLSRLSSEAILVANLKGEVIGVAFQQDATKVWQPFIRFEKNQSKVLLRGISNPIGKCPYPQ